MIYKKIIFQTISFADTLLFSWIKNYLIAFLSMQLLWLIFFLLFVLPADVKQRKRMLRFYSL